MKGHKDCEGCTILNKNKPFHCNKEYDEDKQVDILFLSDSYKWNNGKLSCFRKEEEALLVECLHPLYQHIRDGLKIEFAASVKCPSVFEADMTPNNMKICRKHLNDTIERRRPKLVYVCGNLAMKMLIKKSGVSGKDGKRGRTYLFTSENGWECIVVPLYHPFSVVQEPKNRYLFEVDIRNAYEKYILGKTDTSKFKYTVIHDIEMLKDFEWMQKTYEPVAVDIETTGLDFKKDWMQTIAFSVKTDQMYNICIPVDHQYTPLDVYARGYALDFVSGVLGNKNNVKIFQNGSFDRKFLLRYKIRAHNVWDTKILAKLIREDTPNGLKDLVREYFSEELEVL
jgi:uracil-DNA glycosylase family 4